MHILYQWFRAFGHARRVLGWRHAAPFWDCLRHNATAISLPPHSGRLGWGPPVSNQSPVSGRRGKETRRHARARSEFCGLQLLRQRVRVENRAALDALEPRGSILHFDPFSGRGVAGAVMGWECGRSFFRWRFCRRPDSLPIPVTSVLLRQGATRANLGSLVYHFNGHAWLRRRRLSMVVRGGCAGQILECSVQARGGGRTAPLEGSAPESHGAGAGAAPSHTLASCMECGGGAH